MGSLLRHLVTLQIAALTLMVADSKASDEVKMTAVKAIQSATNAISILIDLELEEQNS